MKLNLIGFVILELYNHNDNAKDKKYSTRKHPRMKYKYNWIRLMAIEIPSSF